MKTSLSLLAGLGAGILLLVLLSCTKVEQQPAPVPAEPTEQKEKEEEDTTMPDQIQITISGNSLPVVLEDNAATRALVDALRQSPITYTARDYGGFEKVGELGHSLPTSNEQITTQAGDVILYSGSQIVLFYGSNSWSYTRLGRIQYESIAELKSFLKAGQGNVSVTLSLGEPSAIAMVSAKESCDPRVVSVDGIRTESPRKGVYIQEGKKYLK